MNCTIVCSDSKIDCEQNILVKYSSMLRKEFRNACSCKPIVILSKDYDGKTVNLMLLVLEGREDIRGMEVEAVTILACMEKFGITWTVEEEGKSWIDPVTGKVQVKMFNLSFFSTHLPSNSSPINFFQLSSIHPQSLTPTQTFSLLSKIFLLILLYYPLIYYSLSFCL